MRTGAGPAWPSVVLVAVRTRCLPLGVRAASRPGILSPPVFGGNLCYWGWTLTESGTMLRGFRKQRTCPGGPGAARSAEYHVSLFTLDLLPSYLPF